MALNDENIGFSMPVQPAYNGGGFGNGFGGDWAWIILLLLLGWGNNGWGGNAGANGATLYPWMNQADITTSGFQNSMLNDNITSIRDGVFGLSTQMCNGFAGTNAAITGAQNAISAQMYANTIADLERSFAAQTANTAAISGVQAQLAQCCCDNRSATQDLKYTIATENCADRAAISDGIRDLLTAQTASTQRILDQLCQDKIDAKNDTIAQLRSQINELSRAASQNAQTAAILANNEAQTAALEQYLAPVPRPAYIVQNPNCCANTCGCGVA